LIQLTADERSSILEIYVLANTPSFIYRRMRELPAAQRLADGSSVAALRSQCSKVAAKKKRTVEEVALAYGAIVALTLKEPQPAKKVFKDIAKLDLDWAENIVAMHLSRPATMTTAEFRMDSPKFGRRRPRAAASSNTVIF
jgi:hypothetical protein